MIEVKTLRLKMAIIFIFTTLTLKLFYLQVIKGDEFYAQARRQQESYLVVNSQRGKIFDSKGRILAMDRDVYSLFANPRQIRDREEVAKKIAQVLRLDFQKVLSRLERNSYFVWIARGLEEGPALEAVKKLNIKGIGLKVERRRIYPQGRLAAHILGAVDIDNNGIAGLELYYNSVLKGRPGYMVVLEDGRSSILGEFGGSSIPPQNGKNLVLSIDQVIQHFAESEAERLYRKYNAKRVSIVIMEPREGDILALANFPSYDPNKIVPQDIENMRNFAISDNFEPGSVLKVVTAAALLEEGLVRLDEKVDCGNGIYRISRRRLHDYHKYGWLDFKSVMVNSSNIGVAKFAQRLEDRKLHRYLELFGIGKKTGIDLPGESAGLLRGVENWSGYSKVSIAMGQEVAVTTLQLAKMMSIIANGGYDVIPHIVKEIIDQNGMRLKAIRGRRGRRLLSESVVKDLKLILKEVVERGTGRYARSRFYLAGGKTGTAQKADLKKGGYSSNKYLASFVGFLPWEDPKMVIALTVDEPQPVHFGGVVCAPGFKRIAEKALVYLTLSPEERVAKNEAESDFRWN